MKFLVDAQLPPALVTVFAALGHEAIHVFDLPDGEATKDRKINQISVETQSIVVSKDMDFLYSHIASRRPWKLLLIRTGNIHSRELCDLIRSNWGNIETLLANHALVQVDRSNVTPIA